MLRILDYTILHQANNRELLQNLPDHAQNRSTACKVAIVTLNMLNRIIFSVPFASTI